MKLANELRLIKWKIGRIFRSIKYSLVFRGDSCNCNICNFQASQFITGGYDHDVLTKKKIVGGGIRENLSCPRCESSDRQRLTKVLLDHFVDQKRFNKILMVAPEYALASHLYTVADSAHFSDLVPERYFWAKDIQKEDATDFTYDDAVFDLIICNHVLEHIPDDFRALNEIHRILKPGGWAILQIPYSEAAIATEEDPSIIDPQDRLAHYGQEDHVRVYALSDFVNRVSNAGFKSNLVDKNMFAKFTKHAFNVNEVGLLFRKPY